MEKNSIAVKIEKIRRAIEGGEYEAALELAKTIDTTKLKSAADLSVLAEAYYRNSDFETALLYFEQIYQRTQTRRILINLINLCQGKNRKYNRKHKACQYNFKFRHICC